MSYTSYTEFNEAKIKCRECMVGLIYNSVVASDGNTENPKIIVIGEAPGADEIKEGRPFVGKAGKLLRQELEKNGINGSNSLITNTMPCRPLNNKFPKDDKLVYRCRNRWLKHELNLLKPDVVLLIGSTPLKYCLGLKGITRKRGTVYTMKLKETGHKTKIVPCLHPSYVLRKQYGADGETIVKQFESDIRLTAEIAGLL